MHKKELENAADVSTLVFDIYTYDDQAIHEVNKHEYTIFQYLTKCFGVAVCCGCEHAKEILHFFLVWVWSPFWHCYAFQVKKEIQEICEDESSTAVCGVDDDFREIIPRLSNKHVSCDAHKSHNAIAL